MDYYEINEAENPIESPIGIFIKLGIDGARQEITNNKMTQTELFANIQTHKKCHSTSQHSDNKQRAQE